MNCIKWIEEAFTFFLCDDPNNAKDVNQYATLSAQFGNTFSNLIESCIMKMRIRNIDQEEEEEEEDRVVLLSIIIIMMMMSILSRSFFCLHLLCLFQSDEGRWSLSVDLMCCNYRRNRKAIELFVD